MPAPVPHKRWPFLRIAIAIVAVVMIVGGHLLQIEWKRPTYPIR